MDKVAIKPNLINRTGRGIHLWYWIEPCHVSLDKICLSVIDMLCKNIQEILDNVETNLSIDTSSSMKLGGLFRLPYSYNTRANQWSEAKTIHQDTPNINELKDILLALGYKSEFFDKKNKPMSKSTKKPTQYKFSKK